MKITKLNLLLMVFLNLGFSTYSSAKNKEMIVKNIENIVRYYQDFPKKGILFQDLLPIYENPEVLHDIVNHLISRYEGNVDAVVGLDARGFILGGMLAYKLSVPFIPARKKGKLPGSCFSASYEKEYGTDTFELSRDALSGGERVLIVDDLIANGGSAQAAISLIKQAGAIPYEFFAFSEVPQLEGSKKLGIPSYILMGE